MPLVSGLSQPKLLVQITVKRVLDAMCEDVHHLAVFVFANPVVVNCAIAAARETANFEVA